MVRTQPQRVLGREDLLTGGNAEEIESREYGIAIGSVSSRKEGEVINKE